MKRYTLYVIVLLLLIPIRSFSGSDDYDPLRTSAWYDANRISATFYQPKVEIYLSNEQVKDAIRAWLIEKGIDSKVRFDYKFNGCLPASGRLITITIHLKEREAP